ncbi:NADH-quinone oxidoreductase subunit G [Campylobacter sp. FMV-PI01]|uniref:NADH-quinone oxidoreductase subunit G n=1 Tax=Campylobacter portucalensis TaxID=2608384 RepID=A0A6L5WHM3_9BACT|nr:NADH-quinone oxidoreductase subunit G [Campylobacter portucalensis]MSN95717.1 NADH-quinone oxidoreductase subunit G [Campylobacter portucalensis]
MANITINGKICECDESESILNIARRNNIYIPAICYLSGCSPTLACRLCMVETGGKIVYSCNAKAKDGMEILTHTDEIIQARKAIMQTYCINHPLECGVCDQSGECELQNFTMHMGVDEVPYAIKDTHKPLQKWGVVDYEPSLCIVCERCVTVCKDKIGCESLKTVPRGGDQVDKNLKDVMQKDAFAVWSKFQKSLIGHSGTDELDCDECGECAAVCPVGALVQSHFTYTSNAWELKKIPSSNPHSSDCELLYYEVKPKSIEDRRLKIYRVGSDFHFGELNRAARFGFDFHNENSTKNEEFFNKIVNGIKNKTIKNIKFNSFITNEEAKILSILKEKFEINLINNEAFLYQKFLQNFSRYSGNRLYSSDFDCVVNSDFIVVAGSFLRYDSPNLGYKFNNALKINKASGLYFHTIKDRVVEKFSKNLITCIHDNDKDIEILLFLLQKFGKNLPLWLSQKLENEFENINLVDKKTQETKEQKISKFSKILGFDEMKLDEILAKKEKFCLIIGEDFIYSKNSEKLAKLAGCIQKYTNFEVLIIPPRTNSLGVAMICDLDKDFQNGKTLGYNESGDISFGVYESDLDAPALNQQEGTFLNLDKRVVPINPAVGYDGYELNDIAKALNVGLENTVDYTSNLGLGFRDVMFDDLENFYDNGGISHRGYKFENIKCQFIDDEFDLTNLNEKFDDFIYKANPVGQFSKFTNNSSILNEVAYLYAGTEFMQKFNLSNLEPINLDDLAICVKFDSNIEGAYLPYFDDKIDIDKIFKTRYKKFNLKKVAK